MESAGSMAPVGRRQLGVIKWYNARKGFGFISPDLDDIPFVIDVVARGNKSSSGSDSGGADVAAARRPAAPADVFMHKSVLQPGVSTNENERVEFELGLDKRGRKVAIRCVTCSRWLYQLARSPDVHGVASCSAAYGLARNRQLYIIASGLLPISSSSSLFMKNGSLSGTQTLTGGRLASATCLSRAGLC